MITATIILAVLAIGVIFMVLDVAYGQEANLTEDMIMDAIKNITATEPQGNLSNIHELYTVLRDQVLDQDKLLHEVKDYCFAHADRPNPIQDLVDKGFLIPQFDGITCIELDKMIARNNFMFAELEKQFKAAEEKYWKLKGMETVIECLRSDMAKKYGSKMCPPLIR